VGVFNNFLDTISRFVIIPPADTSSSKNSDLIIALQDGMMVELPEVGHVRPPEEL
jgi:hypothetical protein